MAARGRGNTVPLRLEIVDAVRVQNGAAWMEYSKAWRGITITFIEELAISCYLFYWNMHERDQITCAPFLEAQRPKGSHVIRPILIDSDRFSKILESQLIGFCWSNC